MRHWIVLAAALALAGCAGHPLDCATGLVAWDDCKPGTAGYNQRHNAALSDASRCTQYGFTPGTDPYANCMMQLDQQRSQANAALLGGLLAKPLVQTPQAASPSPSVTCASTTAGSTTTTKCN